jgi:hypothetical protein
MKRNKKLELVKRGKKKKKGIGNLFRFHSFSFYSILKRAS